MSGSIDLNPKHHKIVSDILYEYAPNRDVLVFGSRAKWTAKDKSDLDLCIMRDEPLPSKKINALNDALDESPIPFKVDVVEWAKIEDSFREIIKRDGVELGWPKLSLAVLAEINSESITKNNEPEKIRYVDISSVGVGQLTEPPKQMEFSEAPSRARRLVKKDDIVISSVRPNRKSRFYVTQDLADVVVSTGFAVIRPDKEFIDPTYLYSIICSDDFVDYLVRNEKGAAYPAVTQDIIGAYTFILPPDAIQKTTAGLVGPINKKIELNQRMNETLEGMARAIFKSWFVDFDPVHAKAEGRTPDGLDEQTAALFPSTFTPDGLPKGWEEKPLGELADILNGYAFKSEDYQENGLRLLRTKNFSEKGYAEVLSDDVFVPDEFWDEYKKYRCELFDFHLVMVGASVGKTSYALSNMMPCLRNQNMWCFRPQIKGTRFFVNLATEKKVSEVMGWASGSARTFFKKGDFQKHTVVYPGNELAGEFSSLVEPLYKKYDANVKQNQTLAALRDTLLPKLISGELRVDDLNEKIQDAL